MNEPRDRPRRGRQAEAARNDLLLLDAARAVFAAYGAGATVAAIAERAGVGIGSLYRRYGSKDDLLRHLCTLAMHQSIDAATAALEADDGWGGLEQYVRTCVALGTGALAPLAGTIETTPQMSAISRKGRRLLDEVVERAQRQRNGLRPDVTALDVIWLIELFGRSGPMDEDENVRPRLLTIALDGLRARTAGRLPGSPPSAQRYEQRWSSSRGSS
jgi:AcrR family transcriptional regulator